MTGRQKSAIVLAGDYGYLRQIESTLKSLCSHNREIKVYIFNQDIPSEWFRATRRQLVRIGSELVDIKLLDSRLDRDWTAGFEHINYMAFARYFIPEYVVEDRVLYLDSDLIVTGEICHLFDLDLGENYLAAVAALHGMTSLFNSGVLLIDNKRWKEEKVFEQLIERTRRDWQQVPEGDQSILNSLFSGRWLALDQTYNFPIGYDYGAYVRGELGVFDLPLTPLPLVLHYISPDKPWNTFSSGRLRQIWWDYAMLDWEEIVAKVFEGGGVRAIPILSTRLHLFTLTNSHLLEHIEQLVVSLPDCCFHIGAYTAMSGTLTRLAQYENVRLYPKIMRVTIEDLMKKADLYLDINHGGKFEDVLGEVKGKGREILSFDTTVGDYTTMMFPTAQPQRLVEFLEGYKREEKIKNS
ncbi:glycosyltransferase [Streptococcus acidominimus]|uniref:Family 8 glycosyl transferase n=4 Tax=Streptococcus acidominimus TaxID=1326 RepID=A0A1Q8EDK9_STRAI|nr:glycosyltransferase family 8 protein [Streptococcus acidominimus]MBF0839952.1 family 8 glycosyl transferase [Streptococcus acidominimus]MBF0848282.1 family 8 glycosyl transferase [Streptococcus danieliae]OLF49860.1 family 8 glycosyl transferase [Streptococcus acidominimus]